MRLRTQAIRLTLVLTVAFFGLGSLQAADAAAGGKEQVAPTNAPATVSPAKPADGGCLDCHGPFGKLIEASGKYVAPSGEKTSPHRYVPHDSKLAKDVPDCTHCHTAHSLDSLPAKGSIDKSKLNVEWCYTTCHHEKNLTSCKECHP